MNTGVVQSNACLRQTALVGLTHMRLAVWVAAGRELASWGTLAHTEPEEQIDQWAWDMRR